MQNSCHSQSVWLQRAFNEEWLTISIFINEEEALNCINYTVSQCTRTETQGIAVWGLSCSALASIVVLSFMYALNDRTPHSSLQSSVLGSIGEKSGNNVWRSVWVPLSVPLSELWESLCLMKSNVQWMRTEGTECRPQSKAIVWHLTLFCHKFITNWCKKQFYFRIRYWFKCILYRSMAANGQQWEWLVPKMALNVQMTAITAKLGLRIDWHHFD